MSRETTDSSFKKWLSTDAGSRFAGRSISSELTLSLVIILVVLEGILLGALYFRQSSAALRELETKADEYANNLSAVLAVPIWDFDDEQISKIGVGFAANDIVDEVRIEDIDGTLLFERRKTDSGGDRIRRTASILHEGQDIGRITFSLSLEAYRKNLAWLRNTLFMIMGLSLVAISVTTGLLLRIFMRKPLAILQKGIDRVARGDHDYQFEEIHHEELSEIAGRFRQMAAKIRQREASLQKEIAERKRGEALVRRSEAKSRALLDALPDLVFQVDRHGTFIDCKGAKEDLAMDPEAFLGKKLDEVLPAEVADTFMERIVSVLSSGEMAVFDYELRFNDIQKAFECRMVAVSGDQTLAVVRNITANRKAEAERSRLEEQLQRAQKMEAIGMLAGGVAHDLNNVLSGLVSYPQLLLMDLAPDSPMRERVEKIQASGERAAHIVQDMLTLARRGVAVSESVNLNTVVEDYLKSPEYETLRRHQPSFELILDLSPDLLAVSGSPFHLSKTIMNLVSNAAEAVSENGTVTIATENRYIDQPIRGYDDVAVGDYVVLRVSDTGVGISEQDVERIFEPFYTKKVMGRSGTGLGMAVVWGTVKDHNGYVDVKSRQGVGTTISVFLPVSAEVAAGAESVEATDEYRGSGETILVVDDVADQRDLAEAMLGRLGYQVASVDSGEAAVAFLQKRPVDLVILDMIMDPGIDGLETYRRILQIRPGQKAIIASGFSESARVRQAEALGVGAYVKKPYLLEAIGPAIRAELDRS
ncbi:MAG: ATP-binding protein [Desulfobacterales bacterium]|jgi:signal transduction histidine kinase